MDRQRTLLIATRDARHKHSGMTYADQKAEDSVA